MFVQTENTPNPNSLKFLPGKIVSKNGSFESQLSSICDDIAYNNNDIDDGLHAGFFSIDELCEIDLVKSVLKRIKNNKFNDSSRLRYELVRNLIKIMMNYLKINI